jgi:hypothetical protein
MHTAYRIYNSLCTLHLPISIILMLSGFMGSFRYLDIKAHSHYYYYHNHNLDIRNKTTDFFQVEEELLTLSSGYLIASISSCLYAIVYLSLYKAETPSLLALPYYHGENDLNEERSAEGVNLAMLSEMIYWSFVLSYSYTAIASNTLYLGTLDFLYLRLLVHLLCIYIICSLNNKTNSRVDIVGSIAFIALIGETFLVIAVSGTQSNLVMSYFHRFLDFLLVLGHRWDMNPSWEVILNCRLFFMAVGGGLLHADLILTSLSLPLYTSSLSPW